MLKVGKIGLKLLKNVVLKVCTFLYRKYSANHYPKDMIFQRPKR